MKGKINKHESLVGDVYQADMLLKIGAHVYMATKHKFTLNTLPRFEEYTGVPE